MSIRLPSVLLFSLLAGTSCSTNSATAPKTTSSKGAEAVPDGHLHIAPFRIVTRAGDEEFVVSVNEAGEISFNDTVMGRVHADGRGIHSGKTVATLAEDGALAFSGESETGHISPAGAWSKDGEPVVSVSPDGNFEGPLFAEAKPGATIRVEGPPEIYRTAVFVYTFAR